MSDLKWRTAIYLRYSDKEDGKAESSSIDSQREMLHYYIDQCKELEFVAEYVDDNFTGTNFNRPGFQRMKQECQEGRIQCILVKDHSRFARKSSKMQMMLEDELEAIRYISKDDHFDSRFDDYDVIFQMKNLFNEMYAQDISRKVHSSIDDKQRAGKFIGAFAPYGYIKSAENKNQLAIDEEAAQIVREIYRMRLNGINVAAIARELNKREILAPYEYKLSKGCHYVSPTAQRTMGRYLWDFSSVNRILRSQTYAGDLEQGRKRQKMRNKPKARKKEDWVIAKDCVPAIINREEFDEVQHLLDHAKHYGSGKSKDVHLFAGVLYCGECGRAMVKTRKNDETVYYACGTRKRSGKSVCDLEYIRYEILKNIILNDINQMIQTVQDWNVILEQENEPCMRYDCGYRQRKDREREILLYKRRKYYADYADGLISKEDYVYFKNEIDRKEAMVISDIEQYNKAQDERSRNVYVWKEHFLKLKKLEDLDRETVQETVCSIRVFKGKKIEITYKFEDFRQMIDTCKGGRANQTPDTAEMTRER